LVAADASVRPPYFLITFRPLRPFAADRTVLIGVADCLFFLRSLDSGTLYRG